MSFPNTFYPNNEFALAMDALSVKPKPGQRVVIDTPVDVNAEKLAATQRVLLVEQQSRAKAWDRFYEAEAKWGKAEKALRETEKDRASLARQGEVDINEIIHLRNQIDALTIKSSQQAKVIRDYGLTLRSGDHFVVSTPAGHQVYRRNSYTLEASRVGFPAANKLLALRSAEELNRNAA
jgi:hypothetical protein